MVYYYAMPNDDPENPGRLARSMPSRARILRLAGGMLLAMVAAVAILLLDCWVHGC